jgi:DNA-binding response OmpR family regulator
VFQAVRPKYWSFLMPRILVVDDQKDIRAMIGMVLRVNQFEIVEAGSAAAALQAFGDAHFDAAIVDVFLGDSNGLELIRALRLRAPELAVIAMSGMAAFDRAAISGVLAGVIYLQKPFRPADLVRAVVAARAAVRSPEADDAASALRASVA